MVKEKPKQISPKQQKEEKPQSEEEGFLTSAIKQQLEGVFAKFEHPVLLRAWLDERPLSGEIVGFLRELEGITDKIRWEEANSSNREDRILPSIELCYEDGRSSGIQFHGVPGGHEFNSFIIALYNVAGPGQAIEQEAETKLKEITQKINIKILVSLSCTMCPETVMSAQKAAAVSEKIEAEMFDLAYFPQLKEQYNVMSVPCMILNDSKVLFGKKGLSEVVNVLTEL